MFKEIRGCVCLKSKQKAASVCVAPKYASYVLKSEAKTFKLPSGGWLHYRSPTPPFPHEDRLVVLSHRTEAVGSRAFYI